MIILVVPGAICLSELAAGLPPTAILYRYTRDHANTSTFLPSNSSTAFDTTVGSLPLNVSYNVGNGEIAILSNYICFFLVNLRILRLDSVNQRFIQIFMNKSVVDIPFMATNQPPVVIPAFEFIL